MIQNYGSYYNGVWDIATLREAIHSYILNRVALVFWPGPEFVRRWWELIACTFPMWEGAEVQLRR